MPFENSKLQVLVKLCHHCLQWVPFTCLSCSTVASQYLFPTCPIDNNKLLVKLCHHCLQWIPLSHLSCSMVCSEYLFPTCPVPLSAVSIFSLLVLFHGLQWVPFSHLSCSTVCSEYLFPHLSCSTVCSEYLFPACPVPWSAVSTFSPLVLFRGLQWVPFPHLSHSTVCSEYLCPTCPVPRSAVSTFVPLVLLTTASCVTTVCSEYLCPTCPVPLSALSIFVPLVLLITINYRLVYCLFWILLFESHQCWIAVMMETNKICFLLFRYLMGHQCWIALLMETYELCSALARYLVDHQQEFFVWQEECWWIGCRRCPRRFLCSKLENKRLRLQPLCEEFLWRSTRRASVILALFQQNVPQSQTQTGIRTPGDVLRKFDIHGRCLRQNVYIHSACDLFASPPREDWDTKAFLAGLTSLAWAVPQHVVSSRNAMATLRWWSLHSYTGTLFIRDRLLAQQHSPSTSGNKASEDGVGLPVWWGHRRWSRARSSLTLWNAFVCVQLQMMPRMFGWGMLQEPACLEHWLFPAEAAGAVISWDTSFSGPWRHPWWLIGLQGCQCYLTESCNVWKRRCWTWQKESQKRAFSFVLLYSVQLQQLEDWHF